jgi:AcrR family transcriptional regulator
MTRPEVAQGGADAGEGAGERRVDGRRARSQRTWTRVLSVARELFIEQGYALTSMDAIAAEAGVSAQTVYNQFGTKCELLASVLDRAIVGDEAPVAVIERPWFFTSEDESAADAIARFVAVGTAILARVAPVYDVIRSASALPEVGRLLADNRRRRRDDQRHLVKALSATGRLRPDLRADHAADVVYGLVNEEVYLMLTVDCGWSRTRFANWLTDALVEQLGTAPSRSSAQRRRLPTHSRPR